MIQAAINIGVAMVQIGTTYIKMIISKESKKNVITALIVIVMSLGITVTPGIFDNELSEYYICSLTLDIGEFHGGISGTGYSGYPFTDSRKSSIYCGTSSNKGVWIKLSTFAEENDIDPYELIVPKIEELPNNNLRKEVVCTMYGGCI